MDKKPLLATRDQRFRVLKSTWDHNGSFNVVIADTRPDTKERIPGRTRRAVRNLARRVDRMRQIKWVRIDFISTQITESGTRKEYHVTASRLDPSHR